MVFPLFYLLCAAIIFDFILILTTDSSQQSELFSKHLVQCLESLTSVTWPCYIAGDFNAATVDWLNLATTHHYGDNIILDFAINNGFLQIV